MAQRKKIITLIIIKTRTKLKIIEFILMLYSRVRVKVNVNFFKYAVICSFNVVYFSFSTKTDLSISKKFSYLFFMKNGILAIN